MLNVHLCEVRFWTNEISLWPVVPRCDQNCILWHLICYVISSINCVASLIPDISCVASVPFTTPLPWLDRIVKCPSDVHFVISVEVVGHPVTFHLLFYEWEFWRYYSFHIQIFSQVIRHIESDCWKWGYGEYTSLQWHVLNKSHRLCNNVFCILNLFLERYFFMLINRYCYTMVQSIEHTVLLFLTVSFSFLSKIENGATLINVYNREVRIFTNKCRLTKCLIGFLNCGLLGQAKQITYFQFVNPFDFSLQRKESTLH